MAKSPRKKLIAWSLSIVIVIALLIIGDRIAAGVAEDKLSDLVASEVAKHDVTMSQPPDVDVTGFPFLTQVIGGEYSEVDMKLTEVGAGDISLPELDVRAKNVTAALSDVMSGDGPITAGHMEADGHISYDSLTAGIENKIDAKVEHTEGNKLKLTATIDANGQPIEVAGNATVEFQDNVVVITASDFAPVDSGLPDILQGIVADAAQQFSQEIPIPELPYDLKFNDPKFDADAIVVSAEADDVPLA